MLEQIKKDLEKLDPSLIITSLEIYERNIRLGFPEELSLLGLFLPYLSEERKAKLEDIAKKYIPSGEEKIENLICIKDIESLNDPILKENYKKMPKKIYEVAFTKITHLDLALALLSEKATEINNKTYFPNQNTFVEFLENVYCQLCQIFDISYYTNFLDNFVIINKYHEEYKKVLEITKQNLTRSKDEIYYIISELKKFQKYPNEIFKGRLKTPASVFKKVYVRKEPVENIVDFVAIRIVTNTISDCYSWLGYIYSLWPPRLSKFMDYIEHPKPTGYKSLHIVVDTKFGPVEFQIRTHNMHRFAEFGLAAHWKYKIKNENKMLEKIKSRLATQNPYFDQGHIFVYTPKKDIIILDKGSCIVDFAYAIHTDLGDHLFSAEVNNKIAPLNYKLKDKDIIMVHADSKKKPNKNWLEFVVSNKTKEKISQSLKIIKINKKIKLLNPTLFFKEKVQVAQCCNPFCDDDVGIYKSTKRKLILHKASCLEKNHLKYSYASDALKTLFLINKRIKIQLSSDSNLLIEQLKTKFVMEDPEINKKRNTITFNTKLAHKEDFTKLKEELLEEEFVESVELV